MAVPSDADDLIPVLLGIRKILASTLSLEHGIELRSIFTLVNITAKSGRLRVAPDTLTFLEASTPKVVMVFTHGRWVTQTNVKSL